MKLKGKTALVTGSSRRLGKAIALELAARGASIVVHFGASGEAATETAAEIEALGVAAWPVQADLREPAEISGLFDQVEALGRGLDVLVNSAASFENDPLRDISLEGWDEVMAVNLRAPFLCIQRATPMMQAAGGGSIVNIADLSAWVPWRGVAHHSTSKAALVHLTQAAALELAPGVRVNCVIPGAILPPPGVSEADEAWLEKREVVPLGRTGASSEVAEAVAFLVGNDFITGAILPVDGGEHLRTARDALRDAAGK